MAGEAIDVVFLGVTVFGLYYLYTHPELLNLGGGNTHPPPGGCDPMTAYMWQIPGTQRLQLVNPCLTLTGKVGRTSSAPDGDYNFDLQLDTSFYRYRSTQGSHGSNVWCEMICQKPVRDSSGADQALDKYRHACPGCNCYHGIKFSYLPKTGDHVRVKGVYVKDVREGGHMEIHPVSSVVKI